MLPMADAGERQSDAAARARIKKSTRRPPLRQAARAQLAAVVRAASVESPQPSRAPPPTDAVPGSCRSARPALDRSETSCPLVSPFLLKQPVRLQICDQGTNHVGQLSNGDGVSIIRPI